ncbi:MAG: carboxylating nicotinate-nucleotide diphosphorylase [Pseudonocardiales bacterium]|nr:carboxylating nicotinate-nucleotide diphosphorylase [Pseudonocardiales bacterium]
MTTSAGLLAITEAGLDPEMVIDVVERALDEDLGAGPDVTATATISASTLGSADAVPRAAGVLAGLPVAAYVFEVIGAGRLRVDLLLADGARVEPGDIVMTVRGPVRDIVTAERTALNLLGHLSGVATLTRAWVDAVAGTEARIRDTRKTLPGLRALEKYAVRCGGGVNHRMSLSDAALVKDNHVIAAGSAARAFELVRAAAPGVPIEVEVDTVAQAREVVDAGAELVLLDNMGDADMRLAVQYARAHGVRTEASGGLTLDRARAVAETGVDFIAVGALTHSAPVLDIGLDLLSGVN